VAWIGETILILAASLSYLRPEHYSYLFKTSCGFDSQDGGSYARSTQFLSWRLSSSFGSHKFQFALCKFCVDSCLQGLGSQV
jgi:hypothetical protein